MNLIIDPEFRDKIPPMSKEDFDGLRDDIIRDGYVRDPLVVWKEENILLDGHHRWNVIQDNLELLGNKYKVDYKSFPDRWAAIAWICANQLHRHNMTEIQRMKLIQEEYEARQKSQGAQVGNRNAQKQSGEIHHFESDSIERVKQGRPDNELKTRPTIAKEHGITENEVRTAIEVGRGIDKAEEVVPGFKKAVLSGDVKITKKDAAALRKMQPETLKESVTQIMNGEKPEAVKKSTPPRLRGAKDDIAEIDAIWSTMTDTERVIEHTVNDLIEDIQVNGKNYINLLRRTIEMKKDWIETDTDRANVRMAIDNIMNKIREVRLAI